MNPSSHFDFSDADFLNDFSNCTFPPTLFTHEAHLRLAWILLKKFDAEKAGEKLCELIQRFDQKFGDGTKYHCTITMAAAQIVNHFMDKKNETFHDFIHANPRLMTHFKDLILAHYTDDVFTNQDAAKAYHSPAVPFA